MSEENVEIFRRHVAAFNGAISMRWRIWSTEDFAFFRSWLRRWRRLPIAGRMLCGVPRRR